MERAFAKLMPGESCLRSPHTQGGHRVGGFAAACTCTRAAAAVPPAVVLWPPLLAVHPGRRAAGRRFLNNTVLVKKQAGKVNSAEVAERQCDPTGGGRLNQQVASAARANRVA